MDKTRHINAFISAWKQPIRLFAFWLLFFAVYRFWFIAQLYDRWPKEAPASVWSAFYHALPLDFSMAAYLCAIPCLLGWGTIWTGLPSAISLRRLLYAYHAVVLLILNIIFSSNIFLYPEWDTPLNYRALAYLRSPQALFDSVTPFFIVAGSLALALFTYIWLRIYARFCAPDSARISPFLAAPATLLQAALLALAIRGAGVMPINESAVYRSPYAFNNHAAVNTAWRLAHSLIESRSTENRYQYADPANAEQTTKTLFAAADTGAAQNLLKPGIQQPNIVLIVMESMTAQVIESLGGRPGLCPQLEQLIRNGVLFDSCYSSGYRTDQGVTAVLAGYPAQPDQSIVLLDDKAEQLNSLTKILRRQGYQSAFVYGGELTFANLGVWLSNQGFDRIISERHFERAQITQRWGADDHQTLQRALQEMNRLKQPFLGVALTLSLHPPYDAPAGNEQKGSDAEKFCKTAAFADQAIGRFFEAAKQTDWYDHTLFVLVADHGSGLPGGLGLDNPQARHIPLIMTGPLISETKRGARIHTIGNHHDIPATVLAQLGLRDASLVWSRDLTKPGDASFAFFTNENGLGWISPGSAQSYYFQEKNWYAWHGAPNEKAQSKAKAYLQTLYDDFLRR